MEKICKMVQSLQNNNKSCNKLKLKNNKKYKKPNWKKKILNRTTFSIGNNSMTTKDFHMLIHLLILNQITQRTSSQRKSFKHGWAARRRGINAWDFSQKLGIFYLLVIQRVKCTCLTWWKTELVRTLISAIQRPSGTFSLQMTVSTFWVVDLMARFIIGILNTEKVNNWKYFSFKNIQVEKNTVYSKIPSNNSELFFGRIK